MSASVAACEAVGTPSSYRKSGGGVEPSFIRYHLVYGKALVGILGKRLDWILDWIANLEDERYPKGTNLSKWALYLKVIWKMKNIRVFKGHLKTVKQGTPQSWHSLRNTWHTAATKKDKHIV